jgi:hypothetical protein
LAVTLVIDYWLALCYFLGFLGMLHSSVGGIIAFVN